MKDTQRKKVYGAESLWRSPHESKIGIDILPFGFGSLVDLDVAKEILKQATEQFQTPRVNLVVNRRLKQWTGWYRWHGSIIEIPDNSANPDTILHEFAHHLDKHRSWEEPYRSHGGSFTEAMIDVVWWFYGEEAAKSLIGHYRFRKAIIGSDEEEERFKKLKIDRKKANARAGIAHNTEGTVFIVKILYPNKDVMPVSIRYIAGTSSVWWDYTENRHYARAWRKLSTAEKWAERWKSEICEIEIEETLGFYDKHIKRWAAY